MTSPEFGQARPIWPQSMKSGPMLADVGEAWRDVRKSRDLRRNGPNLCGCRRSRCDVVASATRQCWGGHRGPNSVRARIPPQRNFVDRSPDVARSKASDLKRCRQIRASRAQRWPFRAQDPRRAQESTTWSLRVDRVDPPPLPGDMAHARRGLARHLCVIRVCVCGQGSELELSLSECRVRWNECRRHGHRRRSTPVTSHGQPVWSTLTVTCGGPLRRPTLRRHG